MKQRRLEGIILGLGRQILHLSQGLIIILTNENPKMKYQLGLYAGKLHYS